VKAHITRANLPQTTEALESGFIPLGIVYIATVFEDDGYTIDEPFPKSIKPSNYWHIYSQAFVDVAALSRKRVC